MKNFLIISLLAIVLTGCGPTLYVPNTVNAPLLEKKGDYKASGSFNLHSNQTAYNFQGAYALADSWAVLANAAFGGDGETQEEHRILEGGGGYFMAFGKNRCGTPVGRMEMMGGFGLGSASDVDSYKELLGDVVNHRYTGRYRRAFLQPAIGYRGRILELSYAVRFSKVGFSKYEHFENGILAERSRNEIAFSTAESVITTSLGYRRGKAFLQIGRVYALDGGESDYYNVTSDTWTTAVVSMGFTHSTWTENCPPKPPVALEPAKPQPPAEPAEPAEPQPLPAPATVVQLAKPKATICLSDASAPDGDVVSVSFNGQYVVQEAELFKQPVCFDVELRQGDDNLMLVHGIADGKFKPNTVRVEVREGRKKRTFNINTEEGKSEEIRFRLD